MSAPMSPQEQGPTTRDDHWQRHATQWDRVGRPLRPSPEDVAFTERAIARRRGEIPGDGFRALMLGVTPELALMRWPQGTTLVAIDHSPAMIRHVWPNAALPDTARAVCGRWEHLPVGSAEMDAVIGDGFYTPLAYPSGYTRVGREIRRVLKTDGVYVARAFIRPKNTERPSSVFDALRSGQINNFHAFKLRLAMALQESAARGVRLSDIWTTWHRCVPDADALARSLRWSIDEIATIDAYRDSNACYTFPTIDELRDVLSLHFIEPECHVPDYELGVRCPTFVLRPK
ncbi:MAG TPA: class I SAM-dependent methyltransferase [Verrucomicrobiae bacterium]|nr:class I SAM-dependent methyltransferase [Verrucomicrobiae bacterium]